MVTIPTIAELKAQILDDIEATIGKTSPVLPKAVFRVIATSIAGVQILLYRFGLWLYNQIFTVTMSDEALSLRGTEYGIVRTPATKWIGTVTVTGTDDTVVSLGELFQKSGTVYEVTEAETISGGTSTVNMRSLETGDDFNLSVADTLSIVSPKTGIDASATVASVTQTAEDQESLSAYRARILFRQQNQPQGGAAPDYIAWALEVSGIGEAFAFRPTAGEPNVNVYPLLDVTDPTTRIPGGTKLTEVETYIEDTTRKPFGAVVSVIAFTELNFDVDISDLSPNTSAVQTAIETALDTYFYARRPAQYDDEPNPRNVISEAQIAKIAVDAGANVATVDLKNAGGGSITSYELDDDELAVMRTLTWL